MNGPIARRDDGTHGYQVALVGKPSWLSNETYSLSLLVVSAACYSIMSCFVKLAAGTGIPPIDLVLYRATFQGTVIVLAMCWFKEEGASHVSLIRHPFGGSHVQMVVVLRGVIGGLGFLLLYYAVTVLPLGDATTLLALNPVVTVLAGAIFLNESIRPTHVLAVVASLLGAILISKPGFVFSDAVPSGGGGNRRRDLGYAVALLSTCCGSAVYLLMRVAGKKGVHTLPLLLSWCFFGFLYSFCLGVILPAVLGNDCFQLPQSRLAWIYVLAQCVAGLFGHFFLNYAARTAPAGLSSIMKSSGIAFSYLLELLVFHQVPDLATVGGVVLIVASLALIFLRREGPVARLRERHTDGSEKCDAEDVLHLLGTEETEGGYVATDTDHNSGAIAGRAGLADYGSRQQSSC